MSRLLGRVEIRFLKWGLFAGLCSMFIYWGWVYWQSLGIAPVENADGTVDYTLVSEKVFARQGREFHREDWVLRFPKDMYVYVPELDDGGPSQLIVNGISLRTDALPNYSIYFYLDAETLKLVGKDRRFDDDVVRVRVIQGHEFHTNIIDGKHRRDYVGSFKKIYETVCSKEKEVAPGVFRLREATMEERIENKKRSEKERVGDFGGILNIYKCSTNPDTYQKYAVYGSSGKRLAGGDCSKNKIKSSCSFSFISDQERKVFIFLKKTYLPDLSNIRAEVIRILNQATVVEKSNIDWGAKDAD